MHNGRLRAEQRSDPPPGDVGNGWKPGALARQVRDPRVPDRPQVARSPGIGSARGGSPNRISIAVGASARRRTAFRARVGTPPPPTGRLAGRPRALDGPTGAIPARTG